MKFITADQRSPEWYAARLGRATASRFKDIIAIGAKGQYLKPHYDYIQELVSERLIGEAGQKEMFINDAMKWGMMNEDLARTTYQLKTGNKVSGEGFIQHDTLMSGASTDGLVNDEGNLEIKCLTPINHLYEIIKHNTMPDVYKAQVQGQLWITGRAWCDFVGYDSRLPVGIDLFTVRVERDDDYINWLEEEVTNFLLEVDKDFSYFLQFLPVTKRTCHNCGVIFIDKVALCTACGTNGATVNKVLEPASMVLGTITDRKAVA